MHRAALFRGVQFMLSMTRTCVMVKVGGKPKNENRGKFINVVISLHVQAVLPSETGVDSDSVISHFVSSIASLAVTIFFFCRPNLTGRQYL